VATIRRSFGRFAASDTGSRSKLRRQSIASRLSGLYATLLGVTVLLVILASSVSLVYELAGFSRDIVFAKHEEARILAEQNAAQGISLGKAAPDIVKAISGIGLSVAVYDRKGIFLAGDKSLRPSILDRVIAGKDTIPLPGPHPYFGPIGMPPGQVSGAPFASSSPGPRSVGKIVYHEAFGLSANSRQVFIRSISPGGPQPPERFSLTAVDGGYVAFSYSIPLLLISLIPYWKVVVTIAVVAMLLSWFVGRLFARQALQPITEVTGSLQALAAGDFTQRRFVMAGGDEVASLTAAYNDAVAGVAAAMDERKRVEERMRQFVADAGHELRTPLTVISGYIDVLRRGALEEPTIARQILGTMMLEKEHMRVLIDRLMRLARLDGEAPPRTEAIDVAELLRSQCDAARRLDEGRAIDYSVEGIIEIRGDRGEIGEAIWNVVENALKYAPDASIHLRATSVDGVPTITIRDEGPGMTESARLHAFERFYRGDERGEVVGSGLGLAIAKRAVERAGGTIALDSAPGHGTTVTIRLSPNSHELR
jgi:signal transduction histidine kinase